MRVYLENNSNNLNDATKLDKFLDECTRFLKLFTVACKDQHCTDPIMTQQFLQVSLIINTLCAYIHKLSLIEGPVPKYSSSCHHAANDDDRDYDSDDSVPPKKIYSNLKLSMALHLSSILTNSFRASRSTFRIL